jgi:hypothetical protein
MSDRFKSKLPFIAVAGVLMFLASVVLESKHKQAFLIDTGQNRPAVLALFSELENIHPDSAGDARLAQWADRVAKEPEIGRVELFSPEGRIHRGPLKKGPLAFLFGNPAADVDVKDLVSPDIYGALDALTDSDLPREQRNMLLAAFAIRAEGTHNDIYRHMIRPVRNANGETVAMAGIAYAINRSSINGMDLAYYVLGGLAFGVYLLSLTIWVFLDARSRQSHPWLWAAFVLVGQLIGLLVYLLARKTTKETSGV